MASREIRAPHGHDSVSGHGAAALEQRFDRDSLYALRAAVAAHAAHMGAPPDRVSHLVIVASELASNAVRHGGGKGRLRLWRGGRGGGGAGRGGGAGGGGAGPGRSGGSAGARAGRAGPLGSLPPP